MCGTEYDFGPQGDVEKIHAAPCSAEKEQGFGTQAIGSVFVFFITPPKGDFVKKADAVLWRRNLR